MEKIELLEKLVEVQEMHIEMMNDYNNLQCSYKSLQEGKNRRIDDLNNIIEGQSEEIGALEIENSELKKQIEDLQKLIPIEVVGQEQEEKI